MTDIPVWIQVVFGSITILGGLYLYYWLHVEDAPSLFDKKKDAHWWDDWLGPYGYGEFKEQAWIGFILLIIAAVIGIALYFLPRSTLEKAMALLL